MLYLIGLGLDLKSISKEGMEAVARAKKIYLEEYTVDFPYTRGQIEEIIQKKMIPADREKVESLEIVDEAQKNNIALLVYGSPLSATTHISLIQEAKRLKIKYKIIHGSSIFDAVAETGLQLYKFGKVTSMPAWKKSFTPTSFMKIVQENMSINSHSLILTDIGLEISEAIKQLKISAKEHNIPLKKVIVCQSLGTGKGKVFYKTMQELEDFDNVRKPFCLIIPSKMHFVEKEALELLSQK
jgi:diphthine synthase